MLQNFVKSWFQHWFVSLPCFRAKITQILRKVFPERWDEIETWFSLIWIAQRLIFFHRYCLSFFNFGHLHKETGGQSWTKSANFRSASFSWKLNSFKFFFKQCFCLLEYYLKQECRQYWTIFGGIMTQKPSSEGHFMDAESVRKTLKTFNLTTTNDILMKLTTIMYLYESVTS